MERLITITEFNGQEYRREIGYNPSDMMGKTPKELVAWMEKNDGERYKTYKLKADRKKNYQRDYLLNQCVGEIGEEIAADLFKSRGWIIDLGTPLGDFKALSPEKKKYLVEVKTTRDPKGPRFFIQQVRNMKRYCGYTKQKPLYYMVLLEHMKTNILEDFRLLEPKTTLYTYKVKRIKPFNDEALRVKTGGRPRLDQKKLMTLAPRVKKYFPTF